MANEILTYKDDNGAIHVIEVDVITNHEDERAAEVTSHPVEKGADINDHVIHAPDILVLEIAQTQSPMPSAARHGLKFTKAKGFDTQTVKLDVRPSLFKAGGLLAVSQAVGGAISSLTDAIGLTSAASGDVNVQVFKVDAPVDRIGELHDQLIDVKQSSRFCSVTWRGRIYPEFILKKVKWTSAKGESGLGRFQLELQSVRIVENAVAELPDPSSLRLKPSKTQAKPPKPKEGTNAQPKASELESAASRLTGWGFAP